MPRLSTRSSTLTCMEHLRIEDPSAVLRGRRAKVIDGMALSLSEMVAVIVAPRRRAGPAFRRQDGGGRVPGIDRRLARRLQAHDDVVGRPTKLEFPTSSSQALGARGHVEGDELAIGRLDLQQVLVLIDRRYCAGEVIVCFGSSLTCAQLGRERARDRRAVRRAFVDVLVCFRLPIAGDVSLISLRGKGARER